MLATPKHLSPSFQAFAAELMHDREGEGTTLDLTLSSLTIHEVFDERPEPHERTAEDKIESREFDVTSIHEPRGFTSERTVAVRKRPSLNTSPKKGVSVLPLLAR